MMKRMRNVKWTAIAALLLLFAGYQTIAQRAQGRGSGMGHGNRADNRMGDRNEPSFRMKALLDLSEEQVTEIERLHLELEKETLPALNKIREKSAQLRTMVTENYDLSGIDQLIEEIADIQVELDKQRIRTHFKVREVLTEEQKIKFDNHFGYRFGKGTHLFDLYGMHGRGWK